MFKDTKTRVGRSHITTFDLNSQVAACDLPPDCPLDETLVEAHIEAIKCELDSKIKSSLENKILDLENIIKHLEIENLNLKIKFEELNQDHLSASATLNQFEQ